MEHIFNGAWGTNMFFALSFIFGLIICFSGYRIFRLVIASTGFLLGSLVISGLILKYNNIVDTQLIIVTALFFGLITAVILSSMYSSAVFLLGAFFGIVVFNVFLVINEITVESNSYIFPALAGGIITYIFRHFMMILITSTLGALMIIIGALYVVANGFYPVYSGIINNIIAIDPYNYLVAWIVLSLVGVAAQILLFVPRKYVYKYFVQYSDKV